MAWTNMPRAAQEDLGTMQAQLQAELQRREQLQPGEQLQWQRPCCPQRAHR